MVPTIQATRRLARDLVIRYGEDAVRAASDRAKAMEQIGNPGAAEIWSRVAEIIARMRGRDGRMDA
jgi:hypothetical protein